MRQRRPQGFTLVELMVVVVIIAITGGIGITYFQRSMRSEQTPAAARALLGTITEARHAALSLGSQVRVRLTVSPRALVTEQLRPGTTSTWDGVATYNLPGTARLCVPQATPLLSHVSSVTCPLAADTTICVAASGKTTLSSDGNCPGTAGNGVTLFLQSEKAGEQQFKIVVYGLTGLAKLREDQWP